MNATTYLLHGIGTAMHAANTVALVGVAPSSLRDCPPRGFGDDQRDGRRGSRQAKPTWCGKPRFVGRSGNELESSRRAPSPCWSGCPPQS
jgi:hypothetical protein